MGWRGGGTGGACSFITDDVPYIIIVYQEVHDILFSNHGMKYAIQISFQPSHFTTATEERMCNVVWNTVKIQPSHSLAKLHYLALPVSSVFDARTAGNSISFFKVFYWHPQRSVLQDFHVLSCEKFRF